MAFTLAHLSDTHLGFRAYGRTDDYGMNLREVDVMKSFVGVLDAIAVREPDLVVHSGDFFHVVRPSNAVIITAFRRLTQFQERRGGRPFVLVAGNHDTPKTAETTSLLKLFEAIPGLFVFAGRAESWEHAELDLELLALPSAGLSAQEDVAWRPQTQRKNRVIVLHGMETMVASELRKDTSDFGFEQTGAPEWSYVAMGDVHTHRAYAPNACYAGATDFTSSDPWGEIGSPKGWVWFDSANGKLEFVESACRTYLDLPPIDATGLTAQELEVKLVANAQWDESALPVVRQRIRNVARETWSRMGVEWRRDLSARALSYQPEASRAAESAVGGGDSNGGGLTLEAEWSAHMTSAPLPGGVQRAVVENTGLQLLREVDAVETAAAEA